MTTQTSPDTGANASSASPSNQFFSSGRFANLAAREAGENWRTLILFFAGFFGLFVILGIYESSKCYFDGVDLGWYAEHTATVIIYWSRAIVFIGGVYLASISFHSLSTPAGALATLMTPASQFEKFFLRWLVAVPLFLLSFLICATVAEWIRVGWVAVAYGIEIRPIAFADYFQCFNYPEGPLTTVFFFMLFVCIQSFFFLGSVVWPRRSMVKTFVTMIAVCFIYFWATFWIVEMLMPSGPCYNTFRSVRSELDDPQIVTGLFDMLFAIVALFNYWLTYRRFRESEIINRW